MTKTIKKILVTTFLVFTILMVFMCVTSNAASFNPSISGTSATVGDTITLTLKANNAAGTYEVSVNNSNISLSSGNKSEFLENESTTLKFKANKTGQSTVTVSCNMADLDNSENKIKTTKTYTITVKAKSTSGSGSGSSSTTPKFTNVDETVYATGSTNVRKSWSTDSSIIGSLEKGESVKRTGKGDNGWSKVTYNGITSYIYSANLITTKPTKSDNKALKGLTVNPGTLTPKFDADTKEYTLEVGADVTELKIDAPATDNKAKVEVEGNKDFKVGENIVKIKVTAEDETVRTYTITVTKKELTENTLSLSKLEVSGVDLEPTFSKDIYSYSVNLATGTTSLNIVAETENKEAKVEITGNEELKDGKNVITIMVTLGEQTATYQIIANIGEKQVVGTTNNKISQPNILIIICAAAAGIIALAIITLIVIHYKNKKEDDNDNDFGHLDYKPNDDIKENDGKIEKASERRQKDKEEKAKQKEEYLNNYQDYVGNTDDDGERKSKRGKHF